MTTVTCNQCRRSFVSAGALHNHCSAKVDHPYCDECERLFRDDQALKQHLANAPVHQDDYDEYDSDDSDEGESCSRCGRYYWNAKALGQHRRTAAIHQDGEPYCELCKRVFVDREALSASSVRKPPSVAPSSFVSAAPEIFNRISTPYDAGAFESMLSKTGLTASHPHLVCKLRNGFPMGDFPQRTETVIFPNYATNPTHVAFIDTYLGEEVDAGRMAGPYTRAEVEAILGPFQCSPLWVKKDDEGPGLPKLRVVRDLSKGDKDHLATNDYIDTQKFPTRFGSVKKVADIITNAPPGTQAMTLDVAKFHRTCPILPAHKAYFVARGSKGFFIEHTCPFGCRSSESNAGSILNAAMHIWKAQGVSPSVKWSDDLAVFRFARGSDARGRFIYPYTMKSAKALIASLRVPWHPDKWCDFAAIFVYIGFLWDLEKKTVCLPDVKRQKYLGRVQSFLDSYQHSRASLDMVITLQGTLVHICFVYPQGCSRLPRIFDLSSSFDPAKPPLPDHLSTLLIEDMKWWKAELSKPDVVRSLTPAPPRAKLEIFVDASTEWGIGGIGVVINGKWDAWTLIPNGQQAHIGWLEALAVELGLYVLYSMGIKDASVDINSDNQGVIGAFGKGRSQNLDINNSIRRSDALLRSRNLHLTLSYVESAKNLADPISRGVVGHSRLRLTSTFVLPKELQPHVARYRGY